VGSRVSMRGHAPPCRVTRASSPARLPPLRLSFTTEAWWFIVPLKFEIALHSGLPSDYCYIRTSISSVRRTHEREEIPTMLWGYWIRSVRTDAASRTFRCRNVIGDDDLRVVIEKKACSFSSLIFGRFCDLHFSAISTIENFRFAKKSLFCAM
jgi:hypothetical protein